LTEKEYRRRADLSDRTGKRLIKYDEKRTADLIAKMPMTKWNESDRTGYISFANSYFSIKFDEDTIRKKTDFILLWTKEIVKYRLHYYFENKDRGERNGSF